MLAERRCSECSKSLAGLASSARTCGENCRKKRQRRRAKLNHETQVEAEATIGQIVRNEAPDVVTRVLHQELEPIVREALDENVLRAISQMVGLTPRAVQVLAEQLESPDPVLAERAAITVMKYTVGHPALVKPAGTTSPPFTVQFELPRPAEQTSRSDQEELITDAVEADATRVCDVCGQEKPDDQFEADSNRCSSCFREYRERLLHSIE